MDRKRQGALDDPGNSFQSFLHLTLSKDYDSSVPRYLYASNFNERRHKHPVDAGFRADVMRNNSKSTLESVREEKDAPHGRISKSYATLKSLEPVKSRIFQAKTQVPNSPERPSVSPDVRKYSDYHYKKESSRKVYETVESLSPSLRKRFINHSVDFKDSQKYIKTEDKTKSQNDDFTYLTLRAVSQLDSVINPTQTLESQRDSSQGSLDRFKLNKSLEAMFSKSVERNHEFPIKGN